MAPFSKVLVANRGEIAIRVFRTLRELGIGCVAVYSEADRGRAHVRAADEAYLVGPGPASESYLRGDVLVETALRAGAEAVHPGYGFLAENAVFARLVEEAGLTWIGPPPAAIELMGSKTAARAAMRAAGVPIIPGAVEPIGSAEGVVALGEEIGYPLLIKAAAGGGGKGMELVASPDEAERAFASATRQGEKYFADSTVYVERFIEDPRHVEVQVLADAHGNVIHLGERDCTIQRRHQKLVEETPSPAVDDALRDRIGRIAVDAARAAGYRSAGTIEGLLTREGEYFFMEMNTRIQVEHTVTELVTGLDLIREQVLVAAGEPLSVRQEDVVLRGHAIECRINAEDVGRRFMPAPGRITGYHEPAGPGVRVDSGIEAGDEVSELYDPMIAKLIVHDVDRDRAIARMLRALAEFRIEGPPTLLGFHRALLEHPCFVKGETCAGVVESKELAERAKELEESLSHSTTSVAGGPDGAVSTVPRLVGVEVDGRAHDVRLLVTAPPWAELARRRRERAVSGAGGGGDGAVVSPMQGTVLKVEVADGDQVAAGQLLCVVEAMKMENEIVAPRAGTVSGLAVAPGAAIASGQLVCVVASAGRVTLAALLERLVADATLTGATLSRPRTSDPSEPTRLTVDPVAVRDGLRWRVRRHFATRTTDELLDGGALVALLSDAIGPRYRQALLHEPEADWQVLAGRGEPRVLRRPPTRPEATLAHDRPKRHVLAEGEAVPYLVELGVQTPEGKVRAPRRAKFRQVNRFVELVEDVVPSLPSGDLRVVDFGSGRAYLTFALHDLLVRRHGRAVDLLGLDVKEDVVAECEALARRLDADGLRFEVGDIAHADLEGVDLVVSLHACDTATDAALDRAVRAGASVILAVPCCQHELLGQLGNETLRPLLRHGTLRERFVAEVTDAARARLLELAGYEVQVVEFVPLEHTPKNVLLRAVRTARPARDRARLAGEYRAFADALGIEPSLERLLGDLVAA